METTYLGEFLRCFYSGRTFRSTLERAQVMLCEGSCVILKDDSSTTVTDAQELDDLIHKNHHNTIEVEELEEENDEYFACFLIDGVDFTFDLGDKKLSKLLKTK